jgi:hypothetical protein
MYNNNLNVHPKTMMANYILYILIAPSHRLNKCQNLATDCQEKKARPKAIPTWYHYLLPGEYMR